MKGAVDSEELPLHISREHLQNSPLIRRINGILTRKILRFFEEMIKKDLEKYIKFYEEFSNFLKQGLTNDMIYKDDIAKILVFETSKSGHENDRITLNEYVERMKEDQKEIYYLVTTNKKTGLGKFFHKIKNHHIMTLSKKKIMKLYFYIIQLMSL
jgi:TNF receptor-associated protein 1